MINSLKFIFTLSLVLLILAILTLFGVSLKIILAILAFACTYILLPGGIITCALFLWWALR